MELIHGALRFKTADMTEKLIPAMGHEHTIVCLTGEG